jgi:basic membrane lipoprotein Med (substrate-binding protein (PBP1-ABC) superfamily)
MKTIFVAVVTSVACLLLVGCGSHSTDLSRAEAKKLVSNAIQELTKEKAKGSQEVAELAKQVDPNKMYDLEVTGITDFEAGGKQVEYTITMKSSFVSNLSKEDQRKLPSGFFDPHPGKAIMRQYDDGWRVVDLNGLVPPHRH